ncbi:MAG TPA: C45 family peptidase [Micromonospora sp.]
MRLSTTGNTPVVTLSGDGYEQGVLHGRAARQSIEVNIEEIRRGKEYLARHGRTFDYSAILRANLDFVRRQEPEVAAELQGIADGADVPFEEIVEHNLLLYRIAAYIPMECSQFLVSSTRAVDGQTRLAKTRDGRVDRMEDIVLHRLIDGGRETVEITHAGCVTTAGIAINSDGLMISTSGVWSGRAVPDLTRAGEAWLIPNGPVVFRRSSTVAEFEDGLRRQRRLTNLNFVCADAAGKGAGLEVTADSLRSTPMTQGHLVRTNHFVSDEIRHLGPSREEYSSTFHRYEVATRAMAPSDRTWCEQDLWDLMADHDGYPQDSICRHNDSGDPALSETWWGAVATWPAGILSSWNGTPCERPDATGA